MSTPRVLLLALISLAFLGTPALAQPALVPMSQLIGDDFNDVQVLGDFAYVAGVRGLTVISVVDPAKPERVTFTSLPNRAHDVEIADSVIYVATWSPLGGVEMFLPYPADPHDLGSIPGSPECSEIQVQGDYLYVAGRR